MKNETKGTNCSERSNQPKPFSTRSIAGRGTLRCLAAVLLSALFSAYPFTLCAQDRETLVDPYHAIAIRTTENVTEGGWVWILEQANAVGIDRIDVLVKQDEDDYRSARTGLLLQSGEFLVPLPGETTAEGWENADWLVEMLARAKDLGIEIWAWLPVFHDSVAAQAFPEARYLGGDGSVFVDAALPGVRARQQRLLAKLLQTYDFDGVSFDWVRYDKWVNGGTGPLAEVFEERTGAPWSSQSIEDPLRRAIWGNLRETRVADWLEETIAEAKAQWPQIKWGAYLLPPEFKEVSQNYSFITRAGVEYVQPMIYWSLWGFTPEWAGDVVDRHAFWARPNTKLVPTFDLNSPEWEHMLSIEAMGDGRVFGYLWYLDTAWTKDHFSRVRRLKGRLRERRAMADLSAIRLPSSLSEGPQPAVFPSDANAWTLVLLAELYEQGILDTDEPVVPVLALHRFVDDSTRLGQSSLWSNTAGFVDQLFHFLRDHQYHVIPLSHLQAYMMAAYATDLPERPVVLTVDDGARSVLEFFHPLAVAYNYPYTLSVITRQLDGTDVYLDARMSDPQMSWAELAQLQASGLVDFVSHTHALHAYAPEAPSRGELAPAALAHRWLPELGRQETPGERIARVSRDMLRSREEFLARTGIAANILTWPYGGFDAVAERAAQDAGFSHFLLFGGSRFAKPGWSPQRIGRISVTRSDETVPLTLPTDQATLQSWWLAFLKFGRQSTAADLMEATLLQLNSQSARHPEAELARAAVDALAGRPQHALQRVARLRTAFPENENVAWSIATFLDIYEPAL